MREVNGKDPINARINISWKTKKPKVQFSYPDKKNQFRGGFGWEIFSLWVLLLIILSFTAMPESVEDKMNELFINDNTSQLDEFNNQRILVLFIILLLIIVPPALIYFPFKQKINSYFPDWQAFTAKKKYKTFTPKDIIERDNEIFVELPVFTNVICDFNATKGFSKYLSEFEIEEHKFTTQSKKGKVKNEWLWYARWYLTKKPKTGKLEVKFK